jgi:hypothetical protein
VVGGELPVTLKFGPLVKYKEDCDYSVGLHFYCLGEGTLL